MKLETLAILCSAFALSGCHKKDEALLAEYGAQKEDIKDLDFQLQRTSRKIANNHSSDPSEKIAKLKSQLKDAESQQEALLDEIAQAKTQTKVEETRLEEYKLSYPIKGN